MNAFPDTPGIHTAPTWQFWTCIALSPIAAAAAAIAGGLIGDGVGITVALALLAVAYAAFLAAEPAIRLMPPARRAGWVLAGLALSVVVAFVAFYVFLIIVLSTAGLS